jgi:hypothetical protein
MIDPRNDSTGFLLARYVQNHERVLALLELLAAELTPKAQDDFLALIGEQAKAEKQAALEIAATEAKAAGLDAVQITTAALAIKAEPLPAEEMK